MITTREEWLEARRSGIGGSESPVIFNGRLYGTTITDLYLEKRRVVEAPDISHVPDVQRGNALEGIVAQLYASEYGVEVDAPIDDIDRWNRFFIRNSELPFMFANVDFAVGDVRKVIGEIKCPRVRGFMKVKNEGLHDHYLIQGLHNMAVTGAERCVFVIFSAELWKMHVEVVERDEQVIAKIVAANRDFWECVQNGEPPVEPAPGERAPMAKSDALPSVDGEEVARVDSADFAAAVSQYLEAGDILEDVKTLQSEAKDQIVSLMGNASIAEGGGARVYYKEQAGRKTFDKKALKASHPDIDLSKFEKEGKPFRAFRIYRTNSE